MPNDLPYMQFYVNDFDNDTCGMSSAAVGVWVRLLIAMHRKKCGELSGTLGYLAKITRCTVDELDAALSEFQAEDICYMSRSGNGDCNDVVTVICRRLKREEQKRINTSARVRKYRERKASQPENPDCNATVTPYTHAYSQSQSTEKENPLAGVKEKALHTPAFDFPHSVDEVLKLAEHPWCGMLCSKEQAEAYFTDRVSRDWIPYGQQKQISSLAQVCADLKKWLMRDLNNENERKQKNANNSKRDVRVIANDPTEFDPADDGSNI